MWNFVKWAIFLGLSTVGISLLVAALTRPGFDFWPATFAGLYLGTAAFWAWDILRGGR